MTDIRSSRSTVKIDADLASLLCAEREKMQRLIAGVRDGAAVDLSLVKLPANALMFPPPDRIAREKAEVALASLREPLSVTHSFRNRTGRLGFKGLWFHDLRGSRATQLLRRRVPIDVVARRLGHDPAIMMRAYAKALPTDDALVAEALSAMSGGVKGGGERA